LPRLPRGRFPGSGEPMTKALDEIRRLFSEGTLAGLSDGQLLERFAAGGDGEAFAAIVAHHGAMVLSVCRSTLGLSDASDAEDAFQATFLVLARRAGSFPLHGSLAGWLQLRGRLARRGVQLSSAWPATAASSTGDFARLFQQATHAAVSAARGEGVATTAAPLLAASDSRGLLATRLPVALALLIGLPVVPDQKSSGGRQAAGACGQHRPARPLPRRAARACSRMRCSERSRRLISPEYEPSRSTQWTRPPGAFYEHFGFVPSPTDALHLFLLMKDIKPIAVG
jgi:hypothetical protein